jgi:hypothetical protein
MISTIHKARMVNTGRRNRNTNLEIMKQPHCIVPYNKFMKGVDRTHQRISYCSTLRKTVMKKKVVLRLINCAFFLQKIQNRNRRTKHEKYLHGFARSWVLQTKNPTSRWPKQENLRRLFRDFREHKLKKTATDGQGRKKISRRTT